MNENCYRLKDRRQRSSRGSGEAMAAHPGKNIVDRHVDVRSTTGAASSLTWGDDAADGCLGCRPSADCLRPLKFPCRSRKRGRCRCTRRRRPYCGHREGRPWREGLPVAAGNTARGHGHSQEGLMHVVTLPVWLSYWRLPASARVRTKQDIHAASSPAAIATPVGTPSAAHAMHWDDQGPVGRLIGVRWMTITPIAIRPAWMRPRSAPDP